MTRANKGGFTLIEMTAVCLVLAVLAATITPSLISMKRTSDRRDLVSALRRLPQEARNFAIAKQDDVVITYDEGSNAFKVEGTDSDGNTEDLKSLAVSDDLAPTAFQSGGQTANSSEFNLTFSPDGHCNGGGIEFGSTSILVDTDGAARFIDGALPNPEDEKWEAGSLEQRIG